MSTESTASRTLREDGERARCEACWANPLSRAERRELARKLARASKRSYAAGIAPRRRRATRPEVNHELLYTSIEMRDLHLDVTERAEVAPQ